MKLSTDVYIHDFSEYKKVNYYNNDKLLYTEVIESYDLTTDEILNDGIASYNYLMTEDIVNKRVINEPSARGVFKVNSLYVLKLIVDFYVTSFVVYNSKNEICFSVRNESSTEWNNRISKVTGVNNYVIDESKFRRIFIFRSGLTDLNIHLLNSRSHFEDLIETHFDYNEFNYFSLDYLNYLNSLSHLGVEKYCDSLIEVSN